MRSADRIAGAALLAGSLAFSAAALNNHIYWGENGPGPAFMPFWLGLVMALLAAMLLVGAVRQRDKGDDWLPHGDGLRRLGLVMGMSIAFVALLNVVGMVLGTVLFMVALLRGLDRIAWPTTLAVAVGLSACIHLVFAFWLRVPLPIGWLGF